MSLARHQRRGKLLSYGLLECALFSVRAIYSFGGRGHAPFRGRSRTYLRALRSESVCPRGFPEPSNTHSPRASCGGLVQYIFSPPPRRSAAASLPELGLRRVAGLKMLCTMPGSGLFRATQERIAEGPVNTGLQNIGSCRHPEYSLVRGS
jgi:hypothetical protein